MNVVARTAELGLRRALGARRSHIASLVLIESSTVGALGGAVGTVLALAAVLAVSLDRGWAPVINPVIAPAAVGAGLAVGVLGGLLPAIRAARMEPADAPRQ